MLTLLILLDKYITTGVLSNAAWDAIKAAWSELSKRSWEDIYFDAFEIAFNKLQPHLAHYSDGYMSLSREDVSQVLHRKLAVPVESLTASELSDDDFVDRLSTVMAQEEVLMIGGHNLSDRDYHHLVRLVVDTATKIFLDEIQKDPVTFQRLLSTEALRLNESVQGIRLFLKDRFGVVIEQLNEISATTQATRDEVVSIRHGVENLQNMPEMMYELLARTQPGVEEQAPNARIDFATELLQGGRPRSALEKLQQLADELEGKSTTSTMRFRLYTNIGTCYLHLRDHVQAREFFILAQSQKRDDIQAITNIGIGELYCGNYDKALEYAHKALAKDSSHANALSLLLDTTYKLGNLNEVDIETRREAEKYVASRRTLAMILREQGDYKAAEKLHLANLQSRDAMPQDATLLAQTVIERIQKEASDNPPLPWMQSKNHTDLSEIENYLNSPLKVWRYSEDRALYHHALVLRSITRALTGRYREATQDCQLVLSENPSHEDALRNGGLAALQDGEFELAQRLLSQIQLPAADADTVVFALSTVYLRVGLHQRAVELLSNSSIDIDPQTKAHRLRLLAQALTMLGDVESAKTVANELLSIDTSSPVVNEAFASIMGAIGELDQAEVHFKRAIETSRQEGRPFYAFRLADFYYGSNQPDKAVIRYEEAGVPEVDCPETRRYLSALLNSGDWNRAYRLAQALRAGGAAIPVVSEVEAKIAHRIDALELAHQLFTELISVDPQQAEHYLSVAEIELRLGNQEEARKTLLLAVERFNDKPLVLMSIAQLLAASDHPVSEVLELAYRARRLGMNEARVQSDYVSLFLQVEQHAQFVDPTHVDVDTAVQIEADGQRTWYILLDTEQPDRSRGEVLPHDPLAERLIGLSRGDTVTVTEHPIRTVTGTICDIQSKFVRAYQETMSSFSMNFPDALGPIRIPFPINDPDKLVVLPNIGARDKEEIIRTYLNRKPLPLGSVAGLMGRSIIEAWQFLATAPEGKLWAATGQIQERGAQAALLTAANAIVLELTALLTLWRLDLVSAIGQRYKHWYIAHSLLDELSIHIDYLEQFGARYMVVYEGMPRLTEVSPEDVQARIKALIVLRQEVKAKAITVPINTALAIGREKLEELESTIGKQQLDSILVAKEVAAPLYSDDLWLRALARGIFEVEGVWTQALLNEFVEQRTVGLEEYFSSLQVLITSNYHYVSVTVDFFLYILERHSWSVSAETQKAFLVLSGPDTTPQSALGISVRVIKETWIRPLLIERKLAVLDVCLQALCTNRPSTQMVESLRKALREAFIVAPLQLHEVERHISLWMAIHH